MVKMKERKISKGDYKRLVKIRDALFVINKEVYDILNDCVDSGDISSERYINALSLSKKN